MAAVSHRMRYGFNTHVAGFKEKRRQIERRKAHTLTYMYQRDKVKVLCSCGGQSKLGSTDVQHKVVM